MKKRVLCIILAMLLAIPVFAACGTSPKPDGGKEGVGAADPGKDRKEEAAADPDYGEEAAADSDPEKETADIGAESKVEYKLNDYEIGYEYTVSAADTEISTEVHAIHLTDPKAGYRGYYVNSIYSGISTGETWFIENGENYDMYTRYPGIPGPAAFVTSFPKNTMGSYLMDLNNFMQFYTDNMNSDMLFLGTQDFALRGGGSRKCNVYSLKLPYYDFDYTIYVDTETGVCLQCKFDMTVLGTDGAFNFVCVRLENDPSKIVMPDHTK